MKTSVRALVLPLCAVAVPALAQEVSGVRFADTMDVDATPMRLNGVGVRHVTIFGVEVYVAGLYLAEPTTDGAVVLRSTTAKRLVVVMKRDVGADQIGPAFREAIERAAGSRAEALRPEIASFARWLPAMHDRDRLVVTYTQAGGLVVTSTSTSHGFHGSAALASAVFGMWLGTHPVEDSLRAGLLRGGAR